MAGNPYLVLRGLDPKYETTNITIANGDNPKVIQELLRHANLKVTMDTYVQGVSDENAKRKARLSR